QSIRGQGSTFWLTLPPAAAAAEDAAETAGEGAPALDQAESAAAYTVLYVEDNPANLRLVSRALDRQHHLRMLTAHTPSLGLELAQAHRPDLILLDLNLPKMDGYQVLEQLKGEPGLAEVPVIAVTAYAMPKDRERALAAGFFEHLAKPLDLDILQTTVSQALEQGPTSASR
ncbi:MAG TPA: response regulator, partial [Gammaproteobacteria bacterium]|nr:response regulator [Gammaproteobacteria bacterium]